MGYGPEVLWELVIALVDIFLMSLPLIILVAFIIGMIVLGIKMKS